MVSFVKVALNLQVTDMGAALCVVKHESEALTAKLHSNESESTRLKLALAQLLTREATVNAVTAFDSSDGAGIDVANAAKLEALFRKSSDIVARAHVSPPALLDATSQTEGWARETGPNMPSKWKKGESIGSGELKILLCCCTKPSISA